MTAQVFLSYSSKDQKVAQTICAALENRGLNCWISSRDVGPGQNFQEAIVKAIRAAKVMVLVFTSHANNSDEIKKELVLASQNRLTIIPVRMEDVVPNEAFAYEFATRQWIDLFANWEGEIDRLGEWIGGVLSPRKADYPAARPSPAANERRDSRPVTNAPAARRGPGWCVALPYCSLSRSCSGLTTSIIGGASLQTIRNSAILIHSCLSTFSMLSLPSAALLQSAAPCYFYR
jgi:hypothetical protein